MARLAVDIHVEGHIGAAEVQFENICACRLKTFGALLPTFKPFFYIGVIGKNHHVFDFFLGIFHQAETGLIIEAVFCGKCVEFLLFQPPVSRLIVYVRKRVKRLFDGGGSPAALFCKLHLVDPFDRRAGSDDKRVFQFYVTDFNR